MAAPLGFKTFNTGDVLTAADTNGYLMQGIWVFASAAARNAAVTSPQEGNTCYLKDTDVIQVYDGANWVTKSGSSPLTTKGDLYTYSTTDTRLAVGATNGHVLTVDSAAATGLKWAAATAGANWSLLNAGGTALTGATTVTVSGISSVDKVMILVSGASAAANDGIRVRFNTDTGSNYSQYGISLASPATYAATNLSTLSTTTPSVSLSESSNNAASVTSGYLLLTGCNASGVKVFNSAATSTAAGGSSNTAYVLGGYYNSASTISSISIVSNGSNLDAGTVFVYTSA